MKSLNRRSLVKGIGGAAALSSATLSTKVRAEPKIVERDVCILGAGASGMYCASRLQEMGQSVMVIEKLDRVGGHAHTHREGSVFQEMGVRIFPDVDVIRNFYKRYGIALNKIDLNQGERKYVDIRTGKESPFETPNIFSILYSLLKYEILCHTKFPYVHREGFELPENLSEDLLLPFGDYLRKHGINQGFAPVTHYLQGYGKVNDLLTIYAYKNMKPHITQNIRQNSFVVPENGTQEIYEKIAAELADNILLSQNIQSVKRDGEFVEVLTESEGGLTVMRAKKLIVSFAPMLKNLSPFGLDENEKDIFGRFKTNYYWTALVKFTGMTGTPAFFNVADKDILKGQIFPGMYTAIPTPMPGVYNILYGSSTLMSDDEVKARMITDMEKLSGDDKAVAAGVKFQEIVKFLDHTPFGLTVSADDIRAGFYDRLNALQGAKNTYYVGAALDTNDTSSVWLQAEKVLKDYFV